MSAAPEAAPAQTRVLLVRHGLSTFNAQRRYQGQHDESVLAEAGRRMAAEAGEALRAYRFDRIITSPLKRAAETAALIAGRLAQAPAIETHPALREVDIPEWEARAHAEVRRNAAAAHRHWLEHPETFQMRRRDGSGPADRFYPLRELHEEAAALWRQLRTESAGSTILLVSHGGTIRALLNTAIDAPVSRHHVAAKTNCAISELVFPGTGSAQLRRVNDTSGLGRLLPAWKADGIRLLLWPTDGGRERPAGALLGDTVPEFLIVAGWNGGDRGDRVDAGIGTPLPRTVAPDPEALLAAIDARLARPSRTGRVTGLVAAPAADLQRFVDRLFDRPTPALAAPWLEPGHLSVIDRDADHPLPFLRALNLTPPGPVAAT